MEPRSPVLPLCIEMTARIRFGVNHIDVLSSTPAHSLSSSQSSRIGVFEGLKYLSISCLELLESKISPLALGTVASPNPNLHCKQPPAIFRADVFARPRKWLQIIFLNTDCVWNISVHYTRALHGSRKILLLPDGRWMYVLPSTLPLRLSQVPRGQSPVLQYRLHLTQMLADWITTWTR